MDISLTEILQDFIREKVQSGEYSSERAVIEMALQQLQDRQASELTGLIDQEFVEFCDREADEQVTLQDVLRATSQIPGLMSQSIIEGERADRF